MKRTKALRVVMAGLLLGGCMPSQMVEEGRYYLGDAGLLDNYRIQRGGNWRLQADSRLYIAQSHFVPVGHTGARPNILAEEAFAAAVQVFPQVRRAEQPLGLDEALGRARQQGMDYLLYTRFARARASGEGDTAAPAPGPGGVHHHREPYRFSGFQSLPARRSAAGTHAGLYPSTVGQSLT